MKTWFLPAVAFALLLGALSGCSAAAADDSATSSAGLSCATSSCSCAEYAKGGLLFDQSCAAADEGLACTADAWRDATEVCTCTAGAFACRIATAASTPSDDARTSAARAATNGGRDVPLVVTAAAIGATAPAAAHDDGAQGWP